MPELTGGCLCGAVRYLAREEPAFVRVCHCRDCQKFTGSAFAVLLVLAKSAVEIRGTMKTFAKPGDSGNLLLRAFCPECGASIAEEPTARPGVIVLNAGTLDDPAAVTPTAEIYCERALPWVRLAGDMQRFPRRAT